MEVAIDKPHATTASDIWTGRSAISLRLSAFEREHLNREWTRAYWNNAFATFNDDVEICGILDTLLNLRKYSHARSPADHVRLEMDYEEEEHVSETSIAIRCEGSHHTHTASWPYESLPGGDPLPHLRADIKHDDAGHMSIKLVMKGRGPGRRRGDDRLCFSRKCQGPTAIIKELSTTMVRNNRGLVPVHPHWIRCMVFLRTLCCVVAGNHMEHDPGRVAENRWAAAATRVGEAMEVEISLPAAMTDAWDASNLSRGCLSCRRRHDNEGAKRLMKVVTGEVIEAGDFEYAAVSYCWSSVKGDEDLLAQVWDLAPTSPFLISFLILATPQIHKMRI